MTRPQDLTWPPSGQWLGTGRCHHWPLWARVAAQRFGAECSCAHRGVSGENIPAGPSAMICCSTPPRAFAGTPNKNSCPARARAGMTASWVAAQSFSAGGGTMLGGGGRLDGTWGALLGRGGDRGIRRRRGVCTVTAATAARCWWKPPTATAASLRWPATDAPWNYCW